MGLCYSSVYMSSPCLRAVQARCVLAEPIVVLARREFVKPEVRSRCVLAVCYGHSALGVCSSDYE